MIIPRLAIIKALLKKFFICKGTATTYSPVDHLKAIYKLAPHTTAKIENPIMKSTILVVSIFI